MSDLSELGFIRLGTFRGRLSVRIRVGLRVRLRVRIRVRVGFRLRVRVRVGVGFGGIRVLCGQGLVFKLGLGLVKVTATLGWTRVRCVVWGVG